MRTKVITFPILEKKDIANIQKQLRDKGTNLTRFLNKQGLSRAYLHNLVLHENNATDFIKLLKSEGISI